MPQKDPSKTEDATPKRRKKAREQGNVPKSQEMPKIISLIAGILALRLFFPHIRDTYMEMTEWFMDQAFHYQLNPESLYHLAVFSIQNIASMLLPFMLIVFFVTIVAIYLQVGFLWTFKPLKPKMKIFNVVEGLKKKFLDLNTLVRLVKNVGIASAVATAPYIIITSEFENFLPLFYEDPPFIVAYILNTAFKMAMLAMIPLLIIAIADVAYTRWDYEQNLKMTKDEVKDERKQAEGNPEVKKEQRKKMQSTTQQRMRQEVPKADVVITNPTHLAVAIKYDPVLAPAPMVLAKGANFRAEKIKDIARENNIPIRENKPLAQALYKNVQEGETIPEDMYKAVASILAQLYKFKKQGSPGGQ